MRYGVALPYTTPRAVARLAAQAEQAGWDGCFVGDAIWCEDPMIALAAAAVATSRVRLGVLLIPAPLRRPWKIASESLALDHLSDGRLVLGLGAGAVWMGWGAFLDEPTDARARAELLDETIDILTLLYRREPFDYSGRHFHLRLTELDVAHYPPAPVQRPRIPIWTPAIWPSERSMRRALRCDGLLVERRGGEPTPQDVAAIAAYAAAHRDPAQPLDIVVTGATAALSGADRAAHVAGWAAAGATWWVEAMYGESEEAAAARIRLGPPRAEAPGP